MTFNKCIKAAPFGRATGKSLCALSQSYGHR